MSETTGNSGIQISGGAINAQALAVGQGARAVVNNSAAALQAAGRDEVLAQLKAVLAALEAHGAALPDKTAADDLVERIAKEAAAEKPDKLTLKSFLGNLAEEVKSVASIAGTVTALATSVAGLFV
jgi:hypothetical protein